MNIRSLQVLNYYQVKDMRFLIQALSENILFFQAETCARRVIIFCDLSDDQAQMVTQLNEKFKEQSKSCQLLAGVEAYQFLLRWSVGLLNAKYHYNDRFVLGRLKKKWDEFTKNKVSLLQGSSYLKVIPALLADSHRIRHSIETTFKDMPMEVRIARTEELCSVMSSGKTNDNHSAEFKMHQKIENDLDTQSTQKVLTNLSKTLRRLQKDASEYDEVKIKDENPQHQNLLIKTRLGITAAWEKRHIEQQKRIQEPENAPASEYNPFQ